MIVLHAWFLPALVEKAHIAMLLQEWDLLHETSQLIVQKVSVNAPVLMQHIVFSELMSYNTLLLDMPLAPIEDRLQISKL